VSELKDLARTLGRLYRAYVQLRDAVRGVTVGPLESALREAISEIVVRWLADLGSARELAQGVDAGALRYEIVKRHLSSGREAAGWNGVERLQ